MSDKPLPITIYMDAVAQKSFEEFRIRHRFKDLTEAVCEAAQAAVACEQQGVISFQFHGNKTITATTKARIP